MQRSAGIINHAIEARIWCVHRLRRMEHVHMVIDVISSRDQVSTSRGFYRRKIDCHFLYGVQLEFSRHVKVSRRALIYDGSVDA